MSVRERWKSRLVGLAAAALLASGCGEAPTEPPVQIDLPGPSLATVAAPGSLTTKATSTGTIALAWTDNSANEVGFEVYRSTSGPTGSYSLRATTAANATGYTDSGLSQATQYCYKVRAKAGTGDTSSGFTSISCATTPLKAPSSMAATISDTTKLTVTWKDNSSKESAFELWRSTTGSSGTYSLLVTLAANTVSYVDAGLAAGKQYCYKARAIGTSTIPNSGFASSVCRTTPKAPTAPANLLASASSPTQVAMVWTDRSSNEGGFEIWRSTTGSSGTFSFRALVAANITRYDDLDLQGGTAYCYKVRAKGGTQFTPGSSFTSASCTTTPNASRVRIITFGDSNTNTCTEIVGHKSSYVGAAPALLPTDPNLDCQVAGHIEATWRSIRSEAIRAVNHSAGSTTTGGDVWGGPNRADTGSPEARTLVNGITRYQAEALGRGYPWSGGEPTNTSFPNGAVRRVNAYVPGPDDFVYVSMGTGDAREPMTVDQTETNLRWMIQQWIAQGLAPDHFILTTLAPRANPYSPTGIPDRNARIRVIASETGVHLIDLSAYVSDDDGLTWKDSSLNAGDGTHYVDSVRAWLAGQVVAWMDAEMPAGF